MESVVIGLDLSHGADRQVRVGAWLGEQLDARLVLATVVRGTTLPGTGATGGAAPMLGAAAAGAYGEPLDASVADSVRRDEERRLRELASAHGLDRAEVRVAFDAVPADGLRAIARDEAAVLLVVGATRHGALGAAILGSTSHAVCADGPCPVVVVPSGSGDRDDGKEPGWGPEAPPGSRRSTEPEMGGSPQ